MTASLLNTPPTDEERQVIHELFLKTRTNTTWQPLVSFMSNKNLGPGLCNMASTRFQSTILMQPQEKNIHGKVCHLCKNSVYNKKDFWRVFNEKSI